MSQLASHPAGKLPPQRVYRPGRDGGGIILTTILGIAGAFVGGYIASALGMGGTVGWIGSVLGAMLILFVLRLVKKA